VGNRAAITISLLSITISVVGLLWQLTLYRLSGARLKVGLIPAVITHRGGVVRGPERGWPTKPPEFTVVDAGDLWSDLACISVANIGRTVVWVSDMGLDFGSESKTKAHPRVVVTARPIAIAGGLTDNSRERLEPGQAVEMYVTVIDSIAWARETRRSRRVVVRATATMAGRHATRSPWRRAWRVPGAGLAVYPHAQLTPEVGVFQMLLRGWPASDVTELYDAWLAVWVALEQGSRGVALATVLEPYIPSLSSRLQTACRLSDVFVAAQDAGRL